MSGRPDIRSRVEKLEDSVQRRWRALEHWVDKRFGDE
jgi:hypothetical protein